MKTKTYVATYLRRNPQLKLWGYQTERRIEAVSIASARKEAREISKRCLYGSMELLDVKVET